MPILTSATFHDRWLKGAGVMSATHLDHRQYGPSDCCPWRQIQEGDAAKWQLSLSQESRRKDFTKTSQRLFATIQTDQTKVLHRRLSPCKPFHPHLFPVSVQSHSRESFAASQCLNILNKESIKEMARWLYGCSNMQHF